MPVSSLRTCASSSSSNPSCAASISGNTAAVNGRLCNVACVPQMFLHQDNVHSVTTLLDMILVATSRHTYGSSRHWSQAVRNAPRNASSPYSGFMHPGARATCRICSRTLPGTPASQDQHCATAAGLLILFKLMAILCNRCNKAAPRSPGARSSTASSQICSACLVASSTTSDGHTKKLIVELGNAEAITCARDSITCQHWSSGD